MSLIIDAHQDLAYNIFSFGRDYRQSALTLREREVNTPVPELQNGKPLLGWPESQQARVAVVFASLFILPRKYKIDQYDRVDFASPAEAYRLYRAQMDIYHRLAEDSPD